MRHVVILEGPDGGGKTTLASQLREEYGYRIVKTGPPAPGDIFRQYADALVMALEGPTTVFDRHYLGESIYGPILRGVDRLGVEGRDTIERIITERGVRLIIVCPPWETLVTGWGSKEDLLKNESTLRTVYDRYGEEAARLGLTPYDWIAPNADEVLRRMIDV